MDRHGTILCNVSEEDDEAEELMPLPKAKKSSKSKRVSPPGTSTLKLTYFRLLLPIIPHSAAIELMRSWAYNHKIKPRIDFPRYKMELPCRPKEYHIMLVKRSLLDQRMISTSKTSLG
jgi:hypothetical protein